MSDSASFGTSRRHTRKRVPVGRDDELRRIGELIDAARIDRLYPPAGSEFVMFRWFARTFPGKRI